MVPCVLIITMLYKIKAPSRGREKYLIIKILTQLNSYVYFFVFFKFLYERILRRYFIPMELNYVEG